MDMKRLTAELYKLSKRTNKAEFNIMAENMISIFYDSQIIHEFQGPYRFFSNFYPCRIDYEGRTYFSVEHAYVAAKSLDPAVKDYCTNPSITAAEIKKYGRTIDIREDWDEVKYDIMFELLVLKFSQKEFKERLQETGDLIIQEGNHWNDTYWGVCLKTLVGENNLGKIIMKIREVQRL